MPTFRNVSISTFCLALIPASVLAQQAKIVRIVVPFAAGGPTDSTVRILSPLMKSYGTLVVDNKPGAGGAIAGDFVRRAAPDGATLGVMTVTELAVNPWLTKRTHLGQEAGLAPVALVATVPNVLVVSNVTAQRLNIHSVADLIKYAKANPAKLTYASGGNGALGHLMAEMLKSRGSFNALHVPYQGGQPAQVALLSGQVDFAFNTLSTWAAYIKSNQVKALAVTSAKRTQELPDVPTLGESFSGFEAETWWGVVAPAATPPNVIESANRAFVAALNNPDVKRRFEDLMIRPAPSTPQEFKDLIQRELIAYEKVVKSSGAEAN